MKLELFMPAKPFEVTQAFGISNPSYLQFGFSKHNGIDFRVDADGIVRAMCDGEVYDVGYNEGAGNYVRYKTDMVWVGPHYGRVGFMYMHAKECLVFSGQKIKAGDAIMVADNTGFSTGPHTHISAYFIDRDNVKMAIGSKETDYCFDWRPYLLPYYADDAQTVITALYKIRDLLLAYLKLIK